VTSEQRIWKNKYINENKKKTIEAIVFYWETLSQHYFGGIEYNYENCLKTADSPCPDLNRVSPNRGEET
jgi:hypothetical protein